MTLDDETLHDTGPATPREIEDRESGASLGRLALDRGFITRAEYESCLRQLKLIEGAGARMAEGALLLKNGFISPERLAELGAFLPHGLAACAQCGRLYRTEVPAACPGCGAPLHLSTREPEVRRKVGKYFITREIGRGGMAIVYEAEDPELKRKIALKVLRESDADSPVIRRLHREAAIAAQMQHPNIVGIHEVAMARGDSGAPLHFIAMDYVEGITFDEILKEGATPLAERLRMLEDVARAVAYAHSKGVVHRDLKPANVLVERGGRVMLTDFGLAHAESFQTRLTRSNAVMGTPHYMAPEQVEGRGREIDARTDIYALGVFLYEILTGRTPFDGDTAVRLYEQILKDDPRPPSRVLRSVPRDLEVICLRAMEKDPGRRYASAEEFAEDLARYGRGEPIHARPPSLLYRIERSLARGKAVILACAGIVAAVLVAGAVLRLREFSRLRSEAREAFASKEWAKAAALSDLAQQIRSDPSLAEISRESRSRLGAEEAENRRKLEEGAAYRRLQAAMKPIEALIDDTRPQFYIASAPIHEKLAAVERGLAELEGLAADPSLAGFPDLWVLLGKGWYLVGDLERAEKYLLRADALKSRDDWMNYYLGRLYQESGMAAQLAAGEEASVREENSRRCGLRAREYLERPSQGWAGASEIDRHVARAYRAFAQSDSPEVLRLCEEGLKNFGNIPGTEEYCNLRGWIEGLQDRMRQVEWYSHALERRPHYAWAFFMRGTAHQQLKETDLALADFDRAIELNPRMADAFVNRALQRALKKDLDGAMTDLETALRLRPGYFPARLNHATMRHRKGDLDGALGEFDELVRDYPERAPAYNNRGTVKLDLRDVEGAAADFTEAVRLDRRYADPRLNLAGIARDRGEWDRAIAEYSAVLEIAPDHYAARVQRASMRLAKGEVEEAIVDLRKALERYPKEAGIHVNLGGAHMLRREFEAAVAEYDKAIGLEPELESAYTGRANARFALGNLDGALEDLETAIRLNPKSPEARGSRGMIRQRRGDLKGAIEDYRASLDSATPGWPHRDLIKKLLADAMKQAQPDK